MILITFYKKFREWLNILFWVFLIIKSSLVIRLIDPTSMGIDLGYFTKIFFAGATIMIFKNLTWLLIKTVWPGLADYFKFQFNTDFNTLLPWQKIVICLSLYCFIVWSLVEALNAFH